MEGCGKTVQYRSVCAEGLLCGRRQEGGVFMQRGGGCEYAGSVDPGTKLKERDSAGWGLGGEELRASPEAGLRVEVA